MFYASVLSLRVRYHYLSKGNNKKKNSEYYINNILLVKNRWRDDAISQKRLIFCTYRYFIKKNNEISLFCLPLRYNLCSVCKLCFVSTSFDKAAIFLIKI